MKINIPINRNYLFLVKYKKQNIAQKHFPRLSVFDHAALLAHDGEKWVIDESTRAPIQLLEHLRNTPHTAKNLVKNISKLFTKQNKHQSIQKEEKKESNICYRWEIGEYLEDKKDTKGGIKFVYAIELPPLPDKDQGIDSYNVFPQSFAYGKTADGVFSELIGAKRLRAKFFEREKKLRQGRPKNNDKWENCCTFIGNRYSIKLNRQTAEFYHDFSSYPFADSPDRLIPMDFWRYACDNPDLQKFYLFNSSGLEDPLRGYLPKHLRKTTPVPPTIDWQSLDPTYETHSVAA